jgi:hypothetical protein
MKQTLIASLVATALASIAMSTGAQAQCDIVGTGTIASGATPVTAGPLNPVTGFPDYVSDTRGTSLQRCIDPLVCFFDPVVPSDPFSLQIGSGGEAFYWSADAVLFNAAGDRFLSVGTAAETAFLQTGPLGQPINGAQFPFLRLRFVLGVPVDGTYTIKHPYGTNVFKITGATGTRDVFSTSDRGLVASSTVLGAVGPFLVTDLALNTAPLGFVGDANGATVNVVGSPCGRNSVELTGINAFTGAAVDFGVGETVLYTDQFVVQGMTFDGKVQTPMTASRLSYSRSLAGAGQIDAFATSTTTAVVTVQDGPTIAAGTGRIALPVTLSSLALNATDGIDSTSVAVVDASAVPKILSISATDALTDKTTYNLPLVDFVDVSQADYDPATGVLSIAAASGDQRVAPTLTVRDLGVITANPMLFTTVAPPSLVIVDSSAGGSSSAPVRIIAAAPPAAPTGLVSTGATSLTMTLSWADNSTNETGFRVYQVVGATRTLVATTAANATTYTATGLTAATAYTFQIDAFNNSGIASSNTVVASTLALPVAPSGVVAALGAARTVNLAWVDNSLDETGFLIQRATVAAGPYTTLTTTLAGVTSLIDATPATGTTYFYRVTAVRGVDVSPVAQSLGLTTPTVPTSAGVPTFTAVSGTSVTVNWADRSLNETGFQVYRRAGTLGAFTAITGVLAANSTSFIDSTVVAGTQYFYRVDASNWAGVAPSGVSLGVTPSAAAQPLVAVAGLTATPTAAPTVLTWTDQASETGFRVRRRAITIDVDGKVTTGAFTTLATTAANVTSYTTPAVLANSIYEYEVAAVSGVTVGPIAPVVRAVPGGIGGVVGTPAIFIANNGRIGFDFNRVNQPAVGGYDIQRCTVTVTDTCAATSAGWATRGTILGRQRASPVTFNETIAASNPRKTYRYRSVTTTGPIVTGVTGTPSATAQIVR